MSKKQATPRIEYDETLVGYARVSTEEQSLDMQIAALERAGVKPERIKSETTSGVAAKRPARDLAVKLCRPGDTLVVWKLDRIGRSLTDLYDFIAKLEKSGIGFRSITEFIDTKSAIGKLAFTMLAAFAQFERDQIAERTREGVKRYRERGGVMGQPKKFGPDDVAKMEDLFRQGYSKAEVARRMRCAPGTIENYVPAARRAKLKRK